MRRIQRDDTDAFAQFYDRHARRAFGLARMVCRRPDIAEEVVQEAFISIWRGRASYRLTEENVGAWAMTIVRYRAVDAVRRHQVEDHWDSRPEDLETVERLRRAERHRRRRRVHRRGAAAARSLWAAFPRPSAKSSCSRSMAS